MQQAAGRLEPGKVSCYTCKKQTLTRNKQQEKYMPHIVEIDSLALPELDVYARLTQAQLRNRG